MEILRTPDERFSNLPGYAFEPHYVEIDGVRVHYVDEGPASAEPVLMLHGEPSWSYLYRKMIPIITAAGYRAVAPDLVGFGRSDKPSRREDYTYQRHVNWMRGVLEALDLQHITLVCQDWGGLIGLRLVAAFPEKFARVIVAKATCDYRSPAHFGDDLEVALRVGEIGRSSFTLVYEITQAATGAQVASGSTVMVCYDVESSRSMLLPDRTRELLERLRG